MAKIVKIRLKDPGLDASPHPVPMEWTLVTLPLPPMIPAPSEWQLTGKRPHTARMHRVFETCSIHVMKFLICTVRTP